MNRRRPAYDTVWVCHLADAHFASRVLRRRAASMLGRHTATTAMHRLILADHMAALG